MLNKIVESCRYLLNNYSEAQDCKNYLDSRLSAQSQELFEFGYFPNLNNIDSLVSLVGENSLLENNLLYTRDIEDSLFPRKIKFSFFEYHPLIMPYKDVYGNVIALIGRSLLSDSERSKNKIFKYKNTPFNKSKHLFGLFENKKDILEKGCVFIVEGQFDVIKAVQHGFKNVVCLGGSDMSAAQFALITRYTNNLCILLDNDEAGNKARKKISEKYGDHAYITNFYLPEPYKDIDEFLSSNKYEDLSFVIKD
jgi:DNA primase catalytic core